VRREQGRAICSGFRGGLRSGGVELSGDCRRGQSGAARSDLPPSRPSPAAQGKETSGGGFAFGPLLRSRGRVGVGANGAGNFRRRGPSGRVCGHRPRHGSGCTLRLVPALPSPRCAGGGDKRGGFAMGPLLRSRGRVGVGANGAGNFRRRQPSRQACFATAAYAASASASASPPPQFGARISNLLVKSYVIVASCLPLRSRVTTRTGMPVLPQTAASASLLDSTPMNLPSVR
jgi:hypothetical protein